MLTLYTRTRGKLRAVAKGARKPRSRKGGHLQPFTRIQAQLARGRAFYLVTQAETMNAYLPLREDLTLTGYAAYLVELLDRFTWEEESANDALFRLLAVSLERLARGDDAWLVTRYYEIRLLDLLGFRPQLFSCVQCGAEIAPEDQFFSPAQGGILCPKCGKTDESAHPVSMETLKYLRHFQRSTYPNARRARPAERVRAESENLMQNYLTYLLERRLNTPEFLDLVR
jgi:DNA repair protein RecO (recombination protein O)